jgi:hypothetical protein
LLTRGESEIHSQNTEACNGDWFLEEGSIWQLDLTMENVGPKLKFGNEE